MTQLLLRHSTALGTLVRANHSGHGQATAYGCGTTLSQGRCGVPKGENGRVESPPTPWVTLAKSDLGAIQLWCFGTKAVLRWPWSHWPSLRGAMGRGLASARCSAQEHTIVRTDSRYGRTPYPRLPALAARIVCASHGRVQERWQFVSSFFFQAQEKKKLHAPASLWTAAGRMRSSARCMAR
jgi:hypothetical protein